VTGAAVDDEGVGRTETGTAVDEGVAAAPARRFAGAAAAAKFPMRATIAVTLTTTVAARLRLAGCPRCRAGPGWRAESASSRSFVGASAITLHPFNAR
jgi:hypothetical protein